MSQPQTVLAHLHEGREELVREVQRLTTAIAELDAVIERVGGAGSGAGLPAPAPVPGAVAARRPAETGRAARRRAKAPGDPRAARRSAPATPRAAARRSASPASAGGPASAAGQKSIRVHVLEMLAAENREFGLAEIIERIHGAGIAAHDDAVRSITIKLMKDGQVERVGRGLYRLTAGAQRAVSRAADSGAATAEPDVAAAAPAEPAGGDPDVAAPSLNLGGQWSQPANDPGDAGLGQG